MKRNSFVKIAVLSLLSVSALAFAEPGVKYISPNNDGVQDNLTIPLKISDRHLIKSWSLVVEDSDGNKITTKSQIVDTVFDLWELLGGEWTWE